MMNIRDREYSLQFNIMQLEFKYYLDRDGIELADAYDTWVDAALVTLDAKNITSAENLFSDLKARILWDFFAKNTDVESRKMYRDVYIPRA